MITREELAAIRRRYGHGTTHSVTEQTIGSMADVINRLCAEIHVLLITAQAVAGDTPRPGSTFVDKLTRVVVTVEMVTAPSGMGGEPLADPIDAGSQIIIYRSNADRLLHAECARNWHSRFAPLTEPTAD